MNILRINGTTRVFGAPQNWNEETSGHCGGLPIRDEIINGIRFMASAWEFSAEEIALLQAGAPLVLRISGVVHPVVALGVGEVPE